MKDNHAEPGDAALTRLLTVLERLLDEDGAAVQPAPDASRGARVDAVLAAVSRALARCREQAGEARQAEEARRESESRYRALFGNMTEGFALGEVIGDAAGHPVSFRFLEINEAFLAQTGLPRDIVGKPITEALPHLEPVWIARYAGVAMTGESERFTEYNADTQRYYEVYCYRPLPGRFAILFRDVTRRRQLEDELREREAGAREAEEALRAIFDSTYDAILLHDERGDILDVNETFLRMYGVASVEQARGLRIAGLSSPSAPMAELPERWARVLAGESTLLEWCARRADDGREFDVEVFLRPIHLYGRRLVLANVRDITERKRAEAALEAERARLQAVLDSLPVAVWIADREGTVIQTNRAVDRIWGKTEGPYGFEEYRAYKGWFIGTDELIEPENWALARAVFKGEASNNEVIDIERFSGERGTILNNAAPVRNREGTIIGGVAVAQDITEQRRAEEALRESEARLRDIIESTTDGYLAIDEEWRYTYVNERAAQMLGARAEDMLGGRVWDLYPAAVGSPFETNYRHTITTGESTHFEAFYPDPLNLWLELHVYRTEEGLAVYFRDVTQRRRAEEALRESEERVRVALEAADLGTWDLDLTTGIADRSLRHDQIWGFTELQPEWSYDIAMARVVPEDRAHIEAAYAEAMQTGRLSHENRVLWPDGSIHWILASGRVRRDGEGRPARVIGVVADITERKRAEEALRESEERFRAVLENMSEGVVLFDESLNSIYQNPASMRITGYRRAEDSTFRAEDLPVEYRAWDLDGRPLPVDEWPVARVSRKEVVQNQILHGQLVSTGHEWIGSYNGSAILDEQGRFKLGFITVRDITEQRRAEEALRESEERLRLALDAARMIAWEYEPATKRVVITQNASDVLALSSERVHETSDEGYALIHPEDVECHRALVDEAIATAGSYISAYRQVRGDEVFWLEERARAITDASGTTTRLVGVTQNITARKRAEEALRESEAKFRSIFEQAAVGIGRVRFDDARWIDVNEAFMRMLGYGREEMLSTPWPRITHPDDLDLDLVPFRRMAAGELDGYSVEKRFIHKQGRVVWARLTLSLVRDADGHPAYEVAVIEDITERKRAEEELRESEARFSAMANNISQLAWMTDATGSVFWYNQRWYEYTGTTLEAMQGWGWRQVHHPDYVDAVTEKFRQAVEQGTFWEDTFPLRGKDGQYRWFLSRAVPIRDETGHVVRWFGTNTDITDLREAQQQLRELTATLEQRVRERTAALEATNRELEAFSYSVSHDLRAPLRGVDGFSKVLLEKYGDRVDATGRDYLTRVRAAAVRMARLIDDMLKLSRIGRQEMARGPVDLAELATDITDDLRQREPDRRVVVEIAPDLTAEGDPALLRIVLDNLLGNAWKFTSATAEARITVGAFDRDGEQVYFVRDNGAGFDMSYADKLFTPFQRLHGEDEFPGTGIGLAIVQRIIARHGGRVWAEGAEGQGATVFFTLGGAA